MKSYLSKFEIQSIINDVVRKTVAGNSELVEEATAKLAKLDITNPEDTMRTQTRILTDLMCSLAAESVVNAVNTLVEQDFLRFNIETLS